MSQQRFPLVTGALMGWFAVGSYLRSRHPETNVPRTYAVTESHDIAPPCTPDGATGTRVEARSSWIVMDRDGNQLDGGGHYRVVADLNMPGAWWSITLYDRGGALRSNAEGRYAFTSLNVIPEDDGRIVIDVAAERPAAALNWLPCRRGETFCLAMRFYSFGTHMLEDVDASDLPQILRVR